MTGRSALGGSSLPRPLRRGVRSVALATRLPTAGLRTLPTFLIIGAQRSGTTSLYYYLERHRDVYGPVRDKGVHYFDTDYGRSVAWYRSHFPLRARLERSGRPWAVGEASPYYLFHPEIPARVARLVPGVRAIAILRDPVQRTVSHHHHEVARGHEHLPLGRALDAEAERLAGEAELLAADPTAVSYPHMHHGYVARSLYAPQIERWLEYVAPEQLLLLRTEDLQRDPIATLGRVTDFLGVEPLPPADYPIYNERSYDDVDPTSWPSSASDSPTARPGSPSSSP
ncbi:MAG: sulfotransferase domain-containing protein [Acidimicrobiia bacterium]|nr:sulfotransferase domain-containing protein [Acidimicrobiia bacterium]